MTSWLAPGATAQSAADVSTITVTIPTNVITGDLLELSVTATANVTWTTPTSPGTWTIAAGPVAQGTSLSLITYLHIVGSGDAGTTVDVAFTPAKRAAAVMRVYRDSAGIVDVTSTTATGNSTSPQAPAVTTVTNGATITPIVAQRLPSGNTSGSWTDPSGYGNKLVACSTSGSGANIAIAAYGKQQTTLGANSAVTIASAFSGAWVGFTIAIRPAVAGTVVSVISEIHSYTESVDGVVAHTGTVLEGFSETVAWGDDATQSVTIVSAEGLTTELFLAGSWVNVTNYVSMSPGDGYQISRGRDRQFDTVNPGTLTLTFDNRDGRFTAGNATLSDGTTANPYYPHIVPNCQIRVTHLAAGFIRRRFTGFVDQWPTTWEGGMLSSVKIAATDGFKPLSRRKLKVMWLEETLSHGPRSIYTLGEAAGDELNDLLDQEPTLSIQLSSSPPGHAALGVAGPFVTGDETALQLLPGGDPGVYTGVSGAVARFPDAVITDLPFTLGVWLITDQMSGVIYHQSYKGRFAGEGSDGHIRGGDYEVIRFGKGVAAGSINVVVNSGTAASPVRSWAESNISVNDGAWHRVHVGVQANGTPFVYIDGVDVTTVIANNASSLVPLTGSFAELFGNHEADSYFNGSASTFTIYDRVIDLQESLDEYLAGATGFSGERSDERIERIGRWVGVQNFRLDAGVTTVGPQDITDKSALQAMQEAEQTEIGTLFMAGDGFLEFHNRYHASGLSPSFTLTGSDIDPDFTQSMDETLLVDQVTVTGFEVGPITRGASVPQASESVDTLLTTTPDLDSFAYYWLTHRATAQSRSPGMGLDPFTESTLAGPVVNSEIGQLISVTDLPPEAAALATQVIESFTETIDRDTWHLDVTTSKADLTQIMIWDQFHWNDGSVWA